jgi:hypothetical protein
MAFLTQNSAKLCKILFMVSEKNANFFAENCRKSQKIVTQGSHKHGAGSHFLPLPVQGDQMVYFQTKNPNLHWQMLVHFTALLILFFGHLVLFFGHLVYFVATGYSFPVLVCCSKKNLAALLGTFTQVSAFLLTSIIWQKRRTFFVL